MSTYKIYCYFNDKNIDCTTINTGVSLSYSHDDYPADYDYSVPIREVNVGTDTTFYAEPKEGYFFNRWVYRIGSPTAPQHTDSRQTFTYAANEDIYIRAEAIKLWTDNCDDYALLNIEQAISFNEDISAANLCIYRISFLRGGEATIYTSHSETSVRGYLTTGNGFSYGGVRGEPLSEIIASDNIDGADNEFEITYNVTAHETYYLWIRAQDSVSEGQTEVAILPPLRKIPKPRITDMTELAGKTVRIEFETFEGGNPSIGGNTRFVVEARQKNTSTWYQKKTFTMGYLNGNIDIDTDGVEKLPILANWEGLTYRVCLVDIAVDNVGTYEFRIRADGDGINYNTSDYSDIAEIYVNGHFEWDNPKIQGGAYNLTAKEWNKLTEYINSVRRKHSLTNYAFTEVYRGRTFKKEIYDEAKNAVQGIAGYGSNIISVQSGDVVTANILNTLRNELNAVPIT